MTVRRQRAIANRANGGIPAGRMSSPREPRSAVVRLAGMPISRSTTRALALAVALVAALAAACVSSTGGAPGSSAPATPAASDAPVGGGVSGNPGDGTVSTGNPGGGAGGPVGPTPVDPGANQRQLQVPKPGQQNPHPVGAQSLQASVDGRHVLVKISWYGGVAPCSVLDSVRVDRGPGAIALTVIEGSSDPTGPCPEIALLKATIVDVGELAPGSWTISTTTGDAPPIQLTIG